MTTPFETSVNLHWGIKIPLRDGIHLNATLYMPRAHKEPTPVIFTLTPYIGQTYHDYAMYYAEHGYPYLTVDVRGRGNSEGVFRPNINEAKDGHDVTEWLAKQPYCNGQVTMWGGSYAGLDQWATAKEFPPHLATIVPVASPYIATDFPMGSNISAPYTMQWLTFTSGVTSQDKIFWGGGTFWDERFAEFASRGLPFKELDTFLGNPNATFQEYVAHPHHDEYWDAYNPTSEQYAKLSIPILTITGIYDGDQPGAFMHYREYMKNTSKEGRDRHYLIIGPWDHAGTRSPKAEFGGLTFGPESLVDLGKLHLEWYAWTMQGGKKPEFLQKHVAYYVTGPEKWRYVDTLEEITAHADPLFLQSTVNPTDIFHSGALVAKPPAESGPDSYVYDPRDVSHVELESKLDGGKNLTDQTLLHAMVGKRLIYHSEPFEKETEISGFFKLTAWLAIDQPDTDFQVSVHEIGIDGSSILLTNDAIRARYRESLREEKLVTTQESLKYDFDRFMFVSRQIAKGSRLRLVIGPGDSIHTQKNYNSGGPISDETFAVARTVTVKLFHDQAHPSALYVPYGQPEV